MKRATSMIALVAMGLVMATSFAAAQDKPAATDTAATAGGEVTIQTLGVEDISSSKFREYRDVPKGVSMPFVNLFSTSKAIDFNLTGLNISQQDQRYSGWANISWLDFGFDYNQIVHRMGNDAHVIWNETAPGVWAMPSSLRQYYSDKVDATPSSGRVYSFYNTLLAPSFADAGLLNLDSLRKRGTYDFDFSKSLPFNLAFTYTRERKDGYRGQGGGDIISGIVAPVVDVPETLNELTQDYAIKFEYRLKSGNVHAALNRNQYTNDQSKQLIDNPFLPADKTYVASPVSGGPGTIMITGMPDNSMMNESFGGLFKFAGQTRVSADLSLGQYTQDQAFLPYTSNTTVLTGTGQPANLTTSLQAPSFNGSMDTTTFNVWLSSRPMENLGIRMSYRSWDLTNKTNRYVITGDLSSVPDRGPWAAADPVSPDAPYGHPTALNYDNGSKRFQGSVTYDVSALTFEGLYRYTSLSRTFREADSGKENGFTLAAIYHAKDWLGLRLSYDDANRTADGTTVYGFQMDEAERRSKRTTFYVELSPMNNMGLTFSYFLRDVTYPNRPDRVPVASGVPVPGVAPFPNTPSGLLSAKYDSFSVDFDYALTNKVDLTAYYQYEKDVSVDQWSGTQGSVAAGYSIANIWNHSGQDKTNTFGVGATFHIVPDKWTVNFNVMDQKVDGFEDITTNPNGSYTLGRTAYPQYLNPAAVWPINDWDDTHITTVIAELDYNVSKAWKVTGGYWYEKYTMADAWTSGTTMFPQATLIFMKPDYGNYTANVGYARLSYRF